MAAGRNLYKGFSMIEW